MIDEKYIGALIHELRLKRGFTLGHIAELTGFSKGLLSRIENGHVSPPIGTLSKIADALNVHISTFFREEGEARTSFVPALNRRYIPVRDAGFDHSFAPLVQEGFGHKLFSPMIVRMLREKFEPVINTAPCDQCVFMLHGKMTYSYEDEKYEMGPEDCLYFRAEKPHGPINLHTDSVEYLMVLCTRFRE